MSRGVRHTIHRRCQRGRALALLAATGCRFAQPLGDSPPADARAEAAADVAPSDSDKLAWRFDQAAAGGLRSCATVAGFVWCWGAHWGGSLGRELDAAQPRALVVPGVDAVTGLAMGDRFTCALRRGAVWCWGENGAGQLGVEAPDHRAEPAVVALPGEATAVSAGAQSACARVAGRWWCWGSLAGAAPREEAWLAGADAVALGFAHRCAWWREGDGGRVRCAGDNTAGQLGDGTADARAEPVDLPARDGAARRDVVALRVTDFTTCVLLAGGREVTCWGTITPAASVTVRSTEPLRDLALGARHVCGLTLAGRVACWGDGADGQLGDGTARSAGDAMGEVPLPAGAVAGSIAAGSRHTCARTLTGDALWCWGLNVSGQLGAGDIEPRAAPVRVVTP